MLLFLTDRNTRNAKIIQATPQNSHIIIIKLIFDFLPFVLTVFLRLLRSLPPILAVVKGPKVCSLDITISSSSSRQTQPLKFKHIDVTSTAIIKSSCLFSRLSPLLSPTSHFVFKASHENYSAFREVRILLLLSRHFTLQEARKFQRKRLSGMSPASSSFREIHLVIKVFRLKRSLPNRRRKSRFSHYGISVQSPIKKCPRVISPE